MKLSIIIPAYNTARYLKNLLPVLSKQLTEETEVLIVDDGSTDDTEQVVSNYINDKLKYLKIKNNGVSNARNVGIDNTCGEYIAFIDSDDLVTDNYIKKMLETCDFGYDYFYISWRSVGTKEMTIKITTTPPMWNCSVWSRCYKRTTIGENRFDIKLNYAEDKKFNEQVIKDNLTHTSIEEPIYIYNIGREDGLFNTAGAIRTGVIIWQSMIQRIGGIETFVYNLAKKLSNKYDVTVLYNYCHNAQLERLSKFVQCLKYNPNKKYLCDTCIMASCWNGYPDTVISTKNEYFQFIHADFKKINFKYNKWNKTTKHFAVSKAVKDSFEGYTGEKAEVLYNLLDDKQSTTNILKLVSMTRLTSEKGYNRMIKLANMLKDNHIKFRWTIFTNIEDYHIKPIDMEEVVFMKSRFDIWDYIKEADYVVQLSDTEGWCYSINEGLQYGVPAIVTNFESATETIKDGYNGYIVDMELNNVDLDKIVNHIPKKFIYKPSSTIDNWIEMLGEPKKIYEYNPNDKVKVKVTKNYIDTMFNKLMYVGTELEVSRARAEILTDCQFAIIL